MTKNRVERLAARIGIGKILARVNSAFYSKASNAASKNIMPVRISNVWRYELGEISLQCPECGSTHIRKNGKKRGKKNHICVACGRQFIDHYDPPKGYSDEFKQECLKLYVNGSGFRDIERVKGVHHTTVINWVAQVGERLLDSYAPDAILLVGELDELETFVGSKKTKSGYGLP